MNADWETKLSISFSESRMMKGGDNYQLAKILDHSNIKMTESLCESGSAAYGPGQQLGAEIWKLLEPISEAVG
jgi:hypothetical protein